MSHTERLLELIEEHVVEHGGDLGGWTRRVDNSLQLFDGRVTLRADSKESFVPGRGQVFDVKLVKPGQRGE
jgi:hypothetical protein